MPNRPMSMFQAPDAAIAMLIAKTRPSQLWWNTGSLGSGSTAP